MSEKYPVLNCFVAKQTAMKHTVIMILVYALSGVPGETGMLCCSMLRAVNRGMENKTKTTYI